MPNILWGDLETYCEIPIKNGTHAYAEGVEALKAGYADLLFDNIMELTSSALRGCIKAPEGKKLVVSDLSNIEGRMLA